MYATKTFSSVQQRTLKTTESRWLSLAVASNEGAAPPHLLKTTMLDESTTPDTNVGRFIVFNTGVTELTWVAAKCAYGAARTRRVANACPFVYLPTVPVTLQQFLQCVVIC